MDNDEMIPVPRSLLRHLRADLLLARLQLEQPIAGASDEVARLLDRDHAQVVELVPYQGRA